MKLFILVAIVICAVAHQCQARGQRPADDNLPVSITSGANNDVDNSNYKIVLQIPNVFSLLLSGLQKFKEYCDNHGWTKLSNYAAYWIDLFSQYLHNRTMNADDTGTISESLTDKKRYVGRYGS